MPIIKCPECSVDVSDSAMKCPSCGVQLRKPTRSGFGKIVKWGFIGFNFLMLLWLVMGMGQAAEGIESMSEAEQAGTAIGAGIGAVLIIGLWVAGDFILGLFMFFTRPK